MSVVVDASIAVKWLVPEADSDAAERLLIGHAGTIQAPDLLLVEVGAMLVRNANERKLARDFALEGLSRMAAWADWAVELHRVTPDLTATAGRLAIDLGHPLKDCIYLVLADRLGCPLATADAKFRDRVGDQARVRLLAELG